jgi:predicted Zn-dependent peptidase
MDRIITITLECGLTLVVEPIANVASVALAWLLPAGSACDPADGDGYAPLLSELVLRGAGSLNAREHSDALDRLGVQRACDVQTHHLRIDATLLGSRLPDALPLIADMVRAPKLPAEALDAVRSLCLQTLEGLDDDPQTLVMLRLRERHLARPLNRHGYGERSVLETATIAQLRGHWESFVKPRRSIFGVAGAVDPQALASQLDRLLKVWRGESREPAIIAPPQRGYLYLPQETAQVHIGVAWDAPPEPDADAMIERLGMGVLSGSTSGRLFTEVRQKRSLCYSVGASYRAGRDTGFVTLYAGTTPERAQETLDVCLEEIRRLGRGVTDEEHRRSCVGLKAHQIMQGESTASRAGALVYDQFRLGRARTLEEIAAAVDAISIDDLNDYLAKRDAGPFTIASIGPTALQSLKDQGVTIQAGGVQ